MNVRLIYWWDVLRDKLWFIPGVCCIGALLLGVITLNFDRAFGLDDRLLIPALETTGTSGRIVLGALIGALVTVVGLAFSLTMLSVSQTSSQYGPRLIRLLFDSNVTQYTLGLFLGTIVYCMIVLRSIRDLDSSGSLFTPHLSILLAELASAACLFGLLRFTNHMTQCMRAETLIQSIFVDLQDSARTLFPEVRRNDDSERLELLRQAEWGPMKSQIALCSSRSGYLQAVDLPSVLHRAATHGHRVDLKKRPGDFVHTHSTLALIEVPEEDSTGMNADEDDASDERQQAADDYRGYFLIGSVRTPRQDVEAAVMELVEAGVRALSPGTNDPVTAVNVVDYLASFLRSLAEREWPGNYLIDDEDVTRVHIDRVSFPELLQTGFDQLRQYASNSVAVHARLLSGLAAIAEVATRPDDLSAIKNQMEMIVRHAELSIEEPFDLDLIRGRASGVQREIAQRSQEAMTPTSS